MTPREAADWIADNCYRMFGRLEAIEQIINMLNNSALMPKEPTEELLKCVRSNPYNQNPIEGIVHKDALRRYNTLYAALTTPPKPKTKMVTVYKYDYVGLKSGIPRTCTRVTRHEAEHSRDISIEDGFLCVSDIYTHEQEMPV